MTLSFIGSLWWAWRGVLECREEGDATELVQTFDEGSGARQGSRMRVACQRNHIDNGRQRGVCGECVRESSVNSSRWRMQ